MPDSVERTIMEFRTNKWIKPEDLNPAGSLFGGTLLRWLDEEAAIYALGQLDNSNVVTKYISEINFLSSVKQGDVIELGCCIADYGRTSITVQCEVRNMLTGERVLTIDKIVFVNLDDNGRPTPHLRRQPAQTTAIYKAQPESAPAEQESAAAGLVAPR
ncbi:hotdog domain-containing protein [Nocardia sp. NPDC051030]|uniref:acyl-CoA thioesterase n=1 Tax=Nocardia sp. NPDC051030 TaxID=3155162 RepID=UPI003443D655